MTASLFIATAHGMLFLEREDGGWHEEKAKLYREDLTSVAVIDHQVLVGTRDGIYRSEDRGKTWFEANAGLTEGHIRSLAFLPDGSGRAIAGTEPAAIFVSDDGGRHWAEIPGVSNLRQVHDWTVPDGAAAGRVRDLAFQDIYGYAAVEQGGVLRSDNRGESWHLVEGTPGQPGPSGEESEIDPRVHSVKIHPSSVDRVFAATRGGLYTTTDGGRNWEQIHPAICRAVWADPGRPGHVLHGPADDVEANGRIEETIDGGETWEPAGEGAGVPWEDAMVDQFLQVEDQLLALLSDGRILAASISEIDWEWNVLLPALDDAAAMAALQE